MNHATTTLLALAAIAPQAGAQTPTRGDVAVAANGMGIPHPTSKKTYPVVDVGKTIQVPEGMVYIPAGKFRVGTGAGESSAELGGYGIGRFSVTNAEYKAFLDATGNEAPRYWAGGTYPEGKANHPVAYVSLTSARKYADWVGRETGRLVAIPTSNEWEKAARGPKGTLYPWGDSADVRYEDGVLTTKLNFNGLMAVDFLEHHAKDEAIYTSKKSKYYGTRTTVDKIAAFDDSGRPTYFSVGPNGSVKAWVSHSTSTGFTNTDAFGKVNAAGGNTTPVGSYEAGKGAYGCYDMAGNIWNWCETIIEATNGVEKGKKVNEIRGGSWYSPTRSCRGVAIGEGREARGAYNTVGFRVVMHPEANP